MVEIFFTKILNADENVYKNLLKFLSPQRREKCLSFRMKSDRLRCLYSALFLNYVLKKRMTEKPIFVYGKYGKPYIKNGGFWFNISHSGKYIALSFGDEESGIDIEKKEVSDINILKSCFTDLQWKNITESSLVHDEFYKNWTLKESFVKFLGEGLTMDINSFEYENNNIFYKNMTYAYRYFDEINGYSMCCSCKSGNFGKDIKYVPQERLISSYKINTDKNYIGL